MAPPRLLILTASHLCRNPRVVKEATTLGHAGYDVTLLNVSAVLAFERLDAALAAGRPFRRQSVDNIGATPAGRLGALQRRTRIWFARRLVRHTPIRTVASLGPAHALLRAARRFPADLTIVHTELPAWVGAQLLRAGRRVAADIEDWYSEDLLPEARRFLPLQQLRRVEHLLLRDAAYTTTTSESLAAALHAEYGGQRPRVIANAFPLQPPPPRRPDRRPLDYVWFSQTVGPGRGLEAFFAAWMRTPPASRVTLIGDVSDEYRAALLAPLDPAQRARIHFTGHVPADALPSQLAAADAGLALEQREPRSRDLTITNKILQYFNAGLAVIATDTAGQREAMTVAEHPGLLVSAARTDEFAATLTRFATDRAFVATCQQTARAAAERTYSWECEAPRLLAIVAGVVGPPR